MELSEFEKSFIKKRQKLARSWPFVGSLMILCVTALAAWLFWKNPLLINPWVVFSRIEADSIPLTTTSMMAGMLPIAILMCLVVLIIALLLSFVAFSNERKHIEIIRRLIRHQPMDMDFPEETE